MRRGWLRADRRALAVLVLTLVAAACGGGADGASGDPAPDEVSTTRLRSDNDAVCDKLRLVDAVDRETARLSGEVSRAIVGGGDDQVLAAAEALAAHLSSSAPEVDAALTQAAAEAPASAAEAIDALAAATAESVDRLIDLLRSAGSAEDIGRLYQALGSAEVPETPVEEAELLQVINRYTDVICGFSMAG